MADNATSSFPKMGMDWMSGGVVNISGQRTPYTMPGVKEGFGKNASPPNSARPNRSQNSYKIQDANGPRCRIVEKIAYAHVGAEAGKVYRNVKRVQGGSQFYSARAAAGNTGNV